MAQSAGASASGGVRLQGAQSSKSTSTESNAHMTPRTACAAVGALAHLACLLLATHCLGSRHVRPRCTRPLLTPVSTSMRCAGHAHVYVSDRRCRVRCAAAQVSAAPGAEALTLRNPGGSSLPRFSCPLLGQPGPRSASASRALPLLLYLPGASGAAWPHAEVLTPPPPQAWTAPAGLATHSLQPYTRPLNSTHSACQLMTVPACRRW